MAFDSVDAVDLPSVLRPAYLADAPHLAQMSARLIERGLAPRWTAPRIVSSLRDTETTGVIAWRGDTIIGFALMRYDFPHKNAHLLLLAVEPGERRSGLGRALVAWLDKIARLGGILRFELEVRADDPGAHTFYERLGYREVARLPAYYKRGLDAVRMIRDARDRYPRAHG